MSWSGQSQKSNAPEKDGAPHAAANTLRYKAIIAYRGTQYHGWQTQIIPPNWKDAVEQGESELPTVQSIAQRTIASIVGHPVAIVGSSRTDAGVHARGQVFHFDTTALQIPPESLRRAINARLPGDVLIRSIEPVSPEFNAVTSTASKRYEYVIWNDTERPVFSADLAWHRWQTLDDSAMTAAGLQLVGTHDFASFAKPGHGREHTVRTITRFDLRRDGERLILGLEGTGFLWQMVRIIVGTLVEVGLARRRPEQIPEMLAARVRSAAGSTAPAHGLYLDRIWFKEPPVKVAETHDSVNEHRP